MKKIAIHGPPRSGTSWLGSLFDSSPTTIYRFQPLFSYNLKGYLNEKSSKNAIENFYDLLMLQDDFTNQIKQKNEGSYPVFFKNNSPSSIVYKETRYHYILENLIDKCNAIKVIGIIRNPIETINSFLNAPKEFKKDDGWKIDDEWEYAPKKNQNLPENYFGYAKWKEIAYLFLKLEKFYPLNFRIVRYEDLLARPKNTVKELFHFCDIPFGNQTSNFLIKSANTYSDDSYGVYKKVSSQTKLKNTLNKTAIYKIINDPDFQRINLRFNWNNSVHV